MTGSSGGTQHRSTWFVLRALQFTNGASGGAAQVCDIMNTAPNRSPVSDWACIPFDIALLIFRCFPLRPRLRVLSLVCKRWRQVILRMPTRLPHLPLRRLLPALSLMNCTSIVVDEKLRVPPPASVRSVRLLQVPPDGPKCICKPFRSTTGLTALSFFMHGRCSCWPSLLASNTPSLTYLSIAFMPHRSHMDQFTQLMPLLPSHYFPRLTSMAIDVEPMYGDSLKYVRAFISAHASQLTALDLRLLSNTLDIPPLPALKALSLSYHFCDRMKEILQRITSLTELCLDNTSAWLSSDQQEAYYPILAPYLRSFAASTLNGARLPPFPRLQTAMFIPPQWRIESYGQYVGHAPVLVLDNSTDLLLGKLPPSIQGLHITILRYTGQAIAPNKLHTLCIRFKNSPAIIPDVFSFANVGASSPCLRTFGIAVKTMTERHAAELCEFLSNAKDLERLLLFGVDVSKFPKLGIDLQAFPWLDVRHIPVAEFGLVRQYVSVTGPESQFRTGEL